ncbi:MAG: DNA polymerase III subunit gamma/tau [Candidatus Roizmanbacteria bacterium]|nr:DNA polymerase III subunit gamma/tau [Candidatus Roizmanbacteria bacterium]
MYYRKYRPQTLQNIDNEKRKALITQLLSHPQHIPHAFLFSGSKGTGKTSTARIIAKVLNCERNMFADKKSKEVDACGVCDTCKAITAGSFLDVHELDGASNRGVDDVRALREEVKFAPVQGRYKLYIIDEAHMLTKEAFNALLKTLEEPPHHVVFILATTEEEKIPDTILSRCIPITFNRATHEELLVSLERIAKGEGLQVAKEALSVIAKAARGSFRDGAKLLEMATQGTDNSIEAITAMLETQGKKGSTELLVALLEHNEKRTMVWLSAFEKRGGSAKLLMESLFDELHELLLAKNVLETASVIPKVVLDKTTKADIASLTKKLIDAYAQTKYSPIEMLPLMIAVSSFCEDKKN